VNSCQECDFRYDSLATGEIAPSLRWHAVEYATRLRAAGADELRAHPRLGSWSALEYACHIHDVLVVQRERIALALREDQPTFVSMRRAERVSEQRYNEQEPGAVTAAIGDAAEALAGALERLAPDQWLRTGVYPWPTTEVRTLEWVGRHSVHEARHHLLDVDRLLASL